MSLKRNLIILFFLWALTACTSTAAEETTGSVLSEENSALSEGTSNILSDSVLMFFEPNRIYIEQYDGYNVMVYENEPEYIYITDESGESIVGVEPSENGFDPNTLTEVYFSKEMATEELHEIVVNSFNTSHRTEAGYFGTLTEENNTSYYSENLDANVEIYYKRYQGKSSSMMINTVVFSYKNCVYRFSLSDSNLIKEWNNDTAIALAKEQTENVVTN